MPRAGPARPLDEAIEALLADDEDVDLTPPSPEKTPSPPSRHRKSAPRSPRRSNAPGPAGDAAENDGSSSSDDEPDDLRLRDDVGPNGLDDEGGQWIEGIYVPPPARPALTFECTGPRLVISNIESVNFKSYAGYHRLGPFHQSFTSIVGPNGSGKSNVIDSMLFVFGVRAQKIRSKKVGVLIHKSDGHFYDYCTVTVHFEEVIDKPDGECDVVPNSQFRVSRTAYKTNETYYELNGKRSSLKEVGKFLRDRKIDLDHNRFLILQGEVEQIAMMKPKAQNEHECGLLEFLEDVIGTVRYKVPLELLGKKLEEVEDEREEHMNRVKLTEKDLRQLEEPRRKAMEYLQLMNDLTLAHNRIYQHKVRDYSNKYEALGKEKEAITAERKGLVEQIRVFEDEKKVFETEVKAVDKALADHAKRDENARERFDRVEKRELELVADGKRKNDLRTKRKKEIKNLESEIDTWSRKPEENQREVAKLKKALDAADKEVENKKQELDAVMQTLDQETKRFKVEKDKHEEELSSLRKKYNEKKAAMDMAQKNLDVYLSEETREKTRFAQLKTDLDAQRASLEQKMKQLEELEKEMREKINRRDTLAKELEDAEKEEARLSQEVRRIHEQLTDKKNEHRNNTGRGRVIEALLKEKKAGRIPGIFGRLGDLGAIDMKYDVAISTACPQLENVLVDTADTGQKCIEFLKANNLPRTTFLALNIQERKYGREMTVAKRFPENAVRLFDLIKVTDQRVLPAFYFVLRDALVVDNLDMATRVAYDKSQRHKVVTLNGDLIEASGTMTGGGNQKISGKMGSRVVVRSEVGADRAEKEAEKAVEALQSSGDQLRQELNAVRDGKDQLLQEREPLLRRLKDVERTVKMLMLDVNNLKASVPALETRLGEQEKRLKQVVVDAKVVQERQADIDGKKTDFEEAEAAVNVVQKKVDDLDAKMKKATSGKANTARDALKQATTRRKNMADEISRLELEVLTAGKRVEKAQKRIEELNAELEELANSIEEIKSERAVKEQEGKEVIAEFDLLEEERKELTAKKKEVDDKVAEITNREGTVKSSLITVEQKLKEKSAEWRVFEQKVRESKDHLAALKLEPVDDDAMPTELPQLSDEQLDGLDIGELKSDIHKLEQALAKDKPNLAILEEYKEKQLAYIKKVDEYDLVLARRTKVRESVDGMKVSRSREFIQGFTTISNRLKELYRIITLGGDAELELVDSMDPFSEGVHFTVRPPKKSWKNIINLSGGEKTLSSLALVFALHYYRPTPFYVMDEIDAALDFKNVSIVGRYIKERTKNAQFIIISLRSQMFELANRMVGIFKVRNVTGSLTIEPEMVFHCALALGAFKDVLSHVKLARRLAAEAVRLEKQRTLERALAEKAEDDEMERNEQDEERRQKMLRLLVAAISLAGQAFSPTSVPSGSQGEALKKCIEEESIKYGIEREVIDEFKRIFDKGVSPELWAAAMRFRKRLKVEEMDPETRLARLRKKFKGHGPSSDDDSEEEGTEALLEVVTEVINGAAREKERALVKKEKTSPLKAPTGSGSGSSSSRNGPTQEKRKKKQAETPAEQPATTSTAVVPFTAVQKNASGDGSPDLVPSRKSRSRGVAPVASTSSKLAELTGGGSSTRGTKRKSVSTGEEDVENGPTPPRRSRSSRRP